MVQEQQKLIFNVTKKDYAKIKEKAKAEERSVASFIRYILKKHLKKNGSKK